MVCNHQFWQFSRFFWPKFAACQTHYFSAILDALCQLLNEVATLFTNEKDLLDEFEQFLPDAGQVWKEFLLLNILKAVAGASLVCLVSSAHIPAVWHFYYYHSIFCAHSVVNQAKV